MEHPTAQTGDILIVNNGLMNFRIVESVTDTNEKEYMLVNTHSFQAELWSKELDFKIGDEVFSEEFTITGILPKNKTQVTHTL